MGLEILLTTLVPALAPALVDGVRGIIARLTGGAGAQPTSVAEVIQLMQAEVEKLKVVAQLDSGGETYKWVEAIRKLQRPVVAAGVLGAYIATTVFMFGDDFSRDQTRQLASIVFSYLFGERALLYAKQGTGK